jgi:hypothetical protein
MPCVAEGIFSVEVFISVDIEGISGVVHEDLMMPGQPEHDRGRASMATATRAPRAGPDSVTGATQDWPGRGDTVEPLSVHLQYSIMVWTGFVIVHYL